MFLGHYAVAFAAKRVAPATSLGTLIAAAATLDLIWPVLVLLGIEQVRIAPGNTAFTPLAFDSYPYSHSLELSVVWGALFGALYWARRRYAAGAITVGVLVLSHWLLDAVVHRPDLPLAPGSSVRIGWGLWQSIAGTLILESALFALGVWIYAAMTRARDRIGSLGWAIFLVFMLVIYLAAAFGPTPPDARAVAWSDLGQWLIVLWAAWIDRHRRVTATLA